MVALSSLKKEDLGESILLTKKHLPPGSGKTSHELVAQGVFGAKVLSLSSSLAGFAMVPVLSSYLWEAAAERPSMMSFAIVANSGLVLLSFTPLLLHFLTKRFPLDVYYNKDKKIAPEMRKMWLPLATAFVHGTPMLLSLDRNAYRDKLAFDELVKNVNIPLDHD